MQFRVGPARSANDFARLLHAIGFAPATAISSIKSLACAGRWVGSLAKKKKKERAFACVAQSGAASLQKRNFFFYCSHALVPSNAVLNGISFSEWKSPPSMPAPHAFCSAARAPTNATPFSGVSFFFFAFVMLHNVVFVLGGVNLRQL